MTDLICTRWNPQTLFPNNGGSDYFVAEDFFAPVGGGGGGVSGGGMVGAVETHQTGDWGTPL